MKLFIDIETVPQYRLFTDANDSTKKVFDKKFQGELYELPMYILEKDKTLQDHYSKKAALFAEFGKVVCVSMGYVQGEEIKMKSYFGDSEFQILTDVSAAFQKATSLVAHNGKEFDYPFLCRRMIVNGVPLPSLLQIQNLKPWEIKLVGYREDMLEMWKFGQFSLESLCNIFEIESPKDGMDGSQVAKVFYEEKDYQKIATYCEGDVKALINVYRSMNYQDAL